MVEQPDGLKIASIFILTIVVTSLVSRTLRSTELRVHGFEPDKTALAYIWEAAFAQSRDPERDRRAADLHTRSDRPEPARLLRLDRGQPDRVSPEVPCLR